MSKYKKGQRVAVWDFRYPGGEYGVVLQDEGDRVLVVFEDTEVGVWVPKEFIREEGE